MSLPSNFRRISLASIFICFYIPQVQAGFWDDAVNTVSNATNKVINDTSDGITNSNDKSPSSPSKVSTSTASEEKEQGVKDSTSTETSSAASNVQSASMTETTASQHSDIDIIGLKLGMTQEQAVAVLKTHNKDFHIVFDKFEILKPDANDPMSGWRTSAQSSNLSPVERLLPNYLKGIHASVSGKNREFITITFSEPPSSNVVKYIKRTSHFDPSAKPSKDIVLGALTKKYGTPTNEGKRILAWDYSSSDDSTMEEKCSSAIEFAIVKRNSLDIPQNTDCGLILTMKINSDNVIASGLEAVMVDYSEVERQKLATEAYHARLLKERDEQRIKDGNQNSAPTL